MMQNYSITQDINEKYRKLLQQGLGPTEKIIFSVGSGTATGTNREIICD